MFSHDFQVVLGHFWRFPDIPGRFGMFPDDSGAFHIVFGAFRSGGSPEKSDVFQKQTPTAILDRKMICWESFEMDFGGVSGGLELISG